MASAIADQESAVRQSVLGLLKLTGYGLTSSGEVERAIASALSVFHSAAAQYAGEFNRTRPHCNWDRLPAELKLEVVRRLPLSHRAKMLGISRDTRALVISEPSLWTTISTPALPDGARCEYLRTMVARSGNCPVDLTWTDPWDFGDWLGAAAPRDEILRAVPRTRTLTLDASYFAHGQTRFWGSRAPLLERLTLISLSPDHCTISPDAWAGEAVPALRELKLTSITIAGAPRSAFASVRTLHIGIAAGTEGMQWLWNWFPGIKKLIVNVLDNDAPLIPAPPASLRHVVVHPRAYCSNTLRVLAGWGAHSVRLLEMFGPFDAVELALEFLDPAQPWSASFTPTCAPHGTWMNATVVRGGALTFSVWSDSSYDQRLQIHTPGLLDQLQRLTLGEGVLGSAFREDIAFPVLRSLSVLGLSEAPSILRGREKTMSAPALEKLVVDLVDESAAAVQVGLALLPDLVARIEHALPLREIVIRLPEDFDRQVPEVTDVSIQLALVAADVRIEYHPAAQCRQDPCICSALRG